MPKFYTCCHICFAGAPALNNLSIVIDSPNLMISWIFDDMGVPINSFNVTVNCGDQSTMDDPSVPMMGNRVVFTRSLAPYPADTLCTATVGASNLLGPSNNLENTFMITVGECMHLWLANIISLMPRHSTRVKRVWCSEQNFFSQGVGPISDLRSPIWLCTEDIIIFPWHKQLYFEQNWR